MVGYDDTYNRALTARSNALQRRKGQMIDRLNGSGRGDVEEEDDDDYLSDGMEGGGAYEDEYEDEMVGGSFEEASREVGGMRTGGRSTGGFIPLAAAAPYLAAAAAPVIGSLFSKVMGLFGRGYSGGKRQVKAQMLADLKAQMKGMRGSARLLPKMRDIAYDTAQDMMKDRRFREKMEASGGMRTGGRATGGFLPMLAMAAAPMLGAKLASMFGLGRNSPIMRGAGFFDWVKKAASDVGNVLAPVGRVLAPVAEALAPIAKDAAVGFVKGKIGAMGKTGKGKCCSCGGNKQSPYDLMYAPRGGAMLARTANAATHHQRENADFKNAVGESIHGADRLDREKRYALGAGGKRLYMKGGVGGQLAAMGQESMFGYDNDEQPHGLTPPRNVATRGYIQGGQRYLTPVDQMRPTVGGGLFDSLRGSLESAANWADDNINPIAAVARRFGVGGRQTGGRPASAWINHVKSYASKHGVSYKDALSQASASYRK